MKKLFKVRQVIWVNGFGFKDAFFGNFDVIVEAETKEEAFEKVESNYNKTNNFGPKYLKQVKLIRISESNKKDFYVCKELNESYGVDMDLLKV
jgi:hypothetical protein